MLEQQIIESETIFSPTKEFIADHAHTRRKAMSPHQMSRFFVFQGGEELRPTKIIKGLQGIGRPNLWHSVHKVATLTYEPIHLRFTLEPPNHCTCANISFEEWPKREGGGGEMPHRPQCCQLG